MIVNGFDKRKYRPLAVTVNAALDLPAEARVTPSDDARIRLVSHDQGLDATFADEAALREALSDGSCALPLLGLAVQHAGPTGTGLTVETWAQSPEGAGLARWLGFVALIFATINVVGGFLVTHRMLSMFRR